MNHLCSCGPKDNPSTETSGLFGAIKIPSLFSQVGNVFLVAGPDLNQQPPSYELAFLLLGCFATFVCQIEIPVKLRFCCFVLSAGSGRVLYPPDSQKSRFSIPPSPCLCDTLRNGHSGDHFHKHSGRSLRWELLPALSQLSPGNVRRFGIFHLADARPFGKPRIPMGCTWL